MSCIQQKGIGPRTAHCGIPSFRLDELDKTLPIFTICKLPDDENKRHSDRF